MMTNNNVYSALRILDQPQTFEDIRRKRELTVNQKRETFNGKVG
jgi:hypothetical protein